MKDVYQVKKTHTQYGVIYGKGNPDVSQSVTSLFSQEIMEMKYHIAGVSLYFSI